MPANLPTRAARPALVSWQLRRPPVKIFFSSFITFIHMNRAKYQNFRDFSLRMYIRQILPAVFASLFVLYSISCLVSLIILVMDNVYKPSICDKTIDEYTINKLGTIKKEMQLFCGYSKRNNNICNFCMI